MSTTLVLPLQPEFLRGRLMATRLSLLGIPQSSQKSRVKSLTWIQKLTNGVATLAIIAGLLVGGGLFLPGLVYQISPGTLTTQSASGSAQLSPEPSNRSDSQPQVLSSQDMSLPEGEWLIIPRIGVRTPLRETNTAEEALNKGVWKVPGYGQPGETDQPLILAAHRYGWQWWWQTDYWKYNSFYLLPTTEVGDRIEIISDHRKWVYEIYAGGEGREITDYDADLILYTCKFLNSPVRHFRYAKLVQG